MAADNDIDDSTAPLIEHLAELRSRLIHSVVAFIIGMVICFSVWQPIFDFLAQPICDALAELGQDCNLQLIKLQEGFMTAIRISLFGGFVLAFPYIGYQMWRFVAPGLYRNEKNAFLPFMIASPALFITGAAFAYYVVTPLAFNFFLGFQQGQGGSVDAETGEMVAGAGAVIVFQGSMEEYLGLTLKFLMAFGLCFQLPVLLTLMGKAGLVSAQGLKNVRKYAVVGILVLAAVVTPPDVITQVILFVVVYGLYEVSIQLVTIVERNREARMRAEGTWFEDDDEDDEAAATEAATPATQAEGNNP